MLALLWGGLLSIVFIVLLYLLIRAFYPSYKLTILSGLVMFVLWIFLFIQSTMMVGALYAKGYVDDIKAVVATFVAETVDASNSLTQSQQQVSQLKLYLTEQYPMLEPYLNRLDVQELMDENMPMENALTEGINKTINFYILKRVLWMVAFWIIGGFLYHFFQQRRSSYRDAHNTSYSSTMKF